MPGFNMHAGHDDGPVQLVRCRLGVGPRFWGNFYTSTQHRQEAPAQTGCSIPDGRPQPRRKAPAQTEGSKSKQEASLRWEAPAQTGSSI